MPKQIWAHSIYEPKNLLSEKYLYVTVPIFDNDKIVGTGMICDTGQKIHIITCAHVVSFFEDKFEDKNEEHRAKITIHFINQSKKITIPFDLFFDEYDVVYFDKNNPNCGDDDKDICFLDLCILIRNNMWSDNYRKQKSVTELFKSLGERIIDLPFDYNHVLKYFVRKYFPYQFSKSDFATPQNLTKLFTIEDIILLGYPEGKYDKHNHLPIVRYGKTSSHPSINYDGRKFGIVNVDNFVCDSGAPIIIYNNGTYTGRGDGNSIALLPGGRFIFLGMLESGFYGDEKHGASKDINELKSAIVNILNLVENTHNTPDEKNNIRLIKEKIGNINDENNFTPNLSIARYIKFNDFTFDRIIKLTSDH